MTLKNIKCFELLTELCQASCGDGDACIISENYRDFANQYEEWVRMHYGDLYERHNSINAVVFSLGEETDSILFCNDEYDLPSWVNNRLWHPDLDLSTKN